MLVLMLGCGAPEPAAPEQAAPPLEAITITVTDTADTGCTDCRRRSTV